MRRALATASLIWAATIGNAQTLTNDQQILDGLYMAIPFSQIEISDGTAQRLAPPETPIRIAILYGAYRTYLDWSPIHPPISISLSSMMAFYFEQSIANMGDTGPLIATDPTNEDDPLSLIFRGGSLMIGSTAIVTPEGEDRVMTANVIQTGETEAYLVMIEEAATDTGTSITFTAYTLEPFEWPQ